MLTQISSWLLPRIEFVFVLPVVAAASCVLLSRAGLLKASLNDAIYLMATPSLAIGYALAFAHGPIWWFDILLFAPQTYILLAMAFVAAARKLRSRSYRTPSVWWIVVIEVFGHFWTRALMLALSSHS